MTRPRPNPLAHALATTLLLSCGGAAPSTAPTTPAAPATTPAAPAISRFRSGVGHDYSDDVERCRSMKHYFRPAGTDWASVRIVSPVTGRVTRIVDALPDSLRAPRRRDVRGTGSAAGVGDAAVTCAAADTMDRTRLVLVI